MNSHNKMAQWAEDLVSSQIQKEGWTLLARNFRHIGTELDIVAMRRNTLLVVEVKLRSKFKLDLSSMQSLLSTKKKLSLLKGANTFITQRELTPDTVRFDLALVVEENGLFQLHRFDNVLN